MTLDTLNQGISVALPEDLKQGIENARNSLTLMEAEYARLAKLSQVEKDSIANKVAELADIEAKTVQANKGLELVINDLTNKTAEVTKLTTEVTNLKTALVETQKASQDTLAQVTVAQGKLDEREKVIASQESDINDRNLKLIQSEGEHASKVEKLRKAME